MTFLSLTYIFVIINIGLVVGLNFTDAEVANLRASCKNKTLRKCDCFKSALIIFPFSTKQSAKWTHRSFTAWAKRKLSMAGEGSVER